MLKIYQEIEKIVADKAKYEALVLLLKPAIEVIEDLVGAPDHDGYDTLDNYGVQREMYSDEPGAPNA